MATSLLKSGPVAFLQLLRDLRKRAPVELGVTPGHIDQAWQVTFRLSCHLLSTANQMCSEFGLERREVTRLFLGKLDDDVPSVGRDAQTPALSVICVVDPVLDVYRLKVGLSLFDTFEDSGVMALEDEDGRLWQ